MRKFWLAVGLVFSVVGFNEVRAQAPGQIGQQGILTDSLGNPIASGTFDLSFRLYGQDEGGTALWSETQTVTVDEGLYVVQLGSENPINLPFDEQYWLGITVGDGEELSPRLQFSAAPYARRANRVDEVGPGVILPASVASSQISPSGGSSGQVLTVVGGQAKWADPEELTGAALPTKSVRSTKLNSEDGEPGEVLLATNSDSVVWGAIETAGLADESVTPEKLSTDGGANSNVMIITSGNAGWGPIRTNTISSKAVTTAKISPEDAPSGQILTVMGDSVGWSDPAGIAEGSITYEKLSTAGALAGDILTATPEDTVGWKPLTVAASNINNGAVTLPKINTSSGASGEVLSWTEGGADWATVDPETFPVGSVPINRLGTSGASAGHVLGYNGSNPQWTVDGLKLPFVGATTGNAAPSLQITSPISFSSENPIDNAYAIHGVMSSTVGGPKATAVRGENKATSAFGVGVWGSHDGGGWGVYGSTPNGLAIYGSSLDGHAGYFDGKVTIIGTLQKSAGSFRIDHPLDPANKYLSHSFVESPDMMNIYNGVVLLDGAGTATVRLPDWFQALNKDYRYQLTPIGAPGPNLYIAEEIVGNQFRIAGGEPGMKVSWEVTGIRNDAYARANRIPVEEDKPPSERGKYLNPEAFGLGHERSLAPRQVGINER